MYRLSIKRFKCTECVDGCVVDAALPGFRADHNGNILISQNFYDKVDISGRVDSAVDGCPAGAVEFVLL